MRPRAAVTPGLPAYITISDSHTFIHWAYLEKLPTETFLNSFDSWVPVSRRGRVLDGGVFLTVLNILVQGYGESSDFELIALEQKQSGGADTRKEYSVLSAVPSAF